MRRSKFAKRNKNALVGIACGIGCALCVGLYVYQVDEQAAASQAEMLARYGGEQIEVCVAKNDIGAGETIRDSDIETRTWIATLLPANAVTSRSDAVGQQVGSSILSGEVISSSRFGMNASQIDVPDGLVAVCVPTKDVQAVGGAIEPGMKADIYAVGPTSTAQLVSSAPILATSLTDSLSSSNAWVTVGVDPSKVEELVSAAENLELYFVLPSDKMADSNSSTQDIGGIDGVDIDSNVHENEIGDPKANDSDGVGDKDGTASGSKAVVADGTAITETRSSNSSRSSSGSPSNRSSSSGVSSSSGASGYKYSSSSASSSVSSSSKSSR